MKTTIVLSLLSLLVSLPAGGSPASAPKLERRISVDLERAPAADVLASFGSILEVEVEIAEGVEGEVTIRLEEVTIKTVMTAVCESIGCTWELTDSGDASRLRFEPAAARLVARLNEAPALDQRIDMSLADASAEKVLSSFAGILEAELRIQCEGARETISIELEAVELRAAIDRVCSAIRCVCVYEPGVLTVR